MSTHKKSFRHLEEILDRYRRERRSNKKRRWFGLAACVKRLLREPVEYPRLRSSDIEFFREIQCELRELIESNGISADQLEDYAALLNGHQSALDERSRSLAFLPLVLIAIAALAAAVGAFVDGSDSLVGAAGTDVVLPAVVAVVSAVVVVVALAERVQIQGWTPTYHEFLLLVEREASRMRLRDS